MGRGNNGSRRSLSSVLCIKNGVINLFFFFYHSILGIECMLFLQRFKDIYDKKFFRKPANRVVIMDNTLLSVLPSPLFAGITPQELPGLLSCLGAKKKQFAKGEIIFAEGEPASYVGLVVSGGVQVLAEDYNGGRAIIAAPAPGEVFAETFACAHKKNMPVSVMASSNTEVLLIDYAKITGICSIGCAFHIRLVENMLAIIAGKNLTLNSKLTHLSKRTTREKLLSYLGEQAQQAGSATFTIPFNRQELADYLVVDRSALSSELGRMQQDGLLTFNRSQFTLAV